MRTSLRRHFFSVSTAIAVASPSGPFAFGFERRHPYLPHSLIAQHAAYAGHTAVGFAYEWSERVSLGLLYGYTPESYGGHDIHSFTGKSQLYLGPLRLSSEFRLQPYLGIGFVYNPDPDLFLILPDQYPRNYYEPTALYGLLFTGIELRMAETWAVGIELALLNSEIAYWRDSGRFEFEHMGSAGLTIRMML